MGKGKYSLGKATTKMSANVKKDVVSINTTKAEPLKDDMMKQFTNISTALANTNTILNKIVKQNGMTGEWATGFKGWARKCKTQVDAAKKRQSALDSKYNEDVKNNVIRTLQERIDALEKQVASMSTQ